MSPLRAVDLIFELLEVVGEVGDGAVRRRRTASYERGYSGAGDGAGFEIWDLKKGEEDAA